MATASARQEDTPVKKAELDERQTDIKERQPISNEEKAQEEEKPNLDEILDQIEGEIKRMAQELSEVYYQSLKCKEDLAKRLELQDKRKDLRKAIIQAHEDFQVTLKKKTQQEERKRELQKTEKQEEIRKSAQEQEVKKTSNESVQRLNNGSFSSSSRILEIETQLALSRSRRRLLNLQLLNDLDLSTFSLSYYSYLYPYRWYTPYRSLYLEFYDYPRLYSPYWWL